MSQTVTEIWGKNSAVTAHGNGSAETYGPQPGSAGPPPTVAEPGAPRHAHTVPAEADRAGAPGEPAGAPPAASPGAGRRTTIVLRYLLGRLAVDHFRRLTRWVWLVPLAGAALLLVRPRWIGLAVVVLGVLLLVARAMVVALLDRLSLSRRFRSVEAELRDAVEAGKTSLQVELRAVGLPSRSWQLALFAIRLARGSARADARSRIRQVDVDRVLPRAQLERALRLLSDATER